MELRASHILVQTLDQALRLRERLDAGEDFASLARENSECPSSEQGGDLGWFSRGMMVADFERACLELDVNEVSQPVQTRFGYHLIQLTGRDGK